MLKGRFPALRNMPGSDLVKIYMTVEALVVIHNILISFRDDPEDIEGYDGVDDDPPEAGRDSSTDHQANEISELEDSDLYRTGLYRRKRLLEFMIL